MSVCVWVKAQKKSERYIVDLSLYLLLGFVAVAADDDYDDDNGGVVVVMMVARFYCAKRGRQSNDDDNDNDNGIVTKIVVKTRAPNRFSIGIDDILVAWLKANWNTDNWRCTKQHVGQRDLADEHNVRTNERASK